MVENLRLLFQDVPTVQIDRYGSLRSWIHEAMHEKYWCQLVERLLLLDHGCFVELVEAVVDELLAIGLFGQLDVLCRR